MKFSHVALCSLTNAIRFGLWQVDELITSHENIPLNLLC